ncbi:hypothetical protein ACIHAX_37020 [Nocardia sp. NPDC051929]|uniref:hypothetical protein n=1 Tax=unclassified Nocardia TaxID=2637762 RepID=UPI003415CDD7
MGKLLGGMVRVFRKYAEAQSAPLNDAADGLRAYLSRLGVSDEAGARALSALAEPFSERGPEAHLTWDSPDTFLRNIYGDLYHTDRSDSARTHARLLAGVPEGWHQIVAAHMREGETPHAGIWLGHGSVLELGHPFFSPEKGFAGESKPGDDALGAYNTQFKSMLVGGSPGMYSTISRHELGHALDHALGWPSLSPAFTEVHREVLRLIKKRDPEIAAHFAAEGRGQEELFAEGFPWFHHIQSPGFGSTAKPAFMSSVDAARHMAGYYDALGSTLGIA